jgi:hypothetical protein
MARGAAAAVLAGALVVGTAVGASAQPLPGGAVAWTPTLEGDATGVELIDGVLRLDPGDPVDQGGSEEGSEGDVREDRPLGLFTLPKHDLDVEGQRLEVALDVTGPGVSVDVRGKRSSGKWTEWSTATPPQGGNGPATADLSSPVKRVQVRIVFAKDATAESAVRGLTVTAHPARGPDQPVDEQMRSYRVFATREGS